MIGESVFFANGLDAFEFSEIPAGTAAFVRCVFDTDQRRQGAVIKVRGIYRRFDLFRGHHSPMTVDQFTGYTTVKARSPTLVVVDMRVFIADQLVSGIGCLLYTS